MNLITCGALLCLHIDWISNDKRIVFLACFVFAVSGLTVATLFKKEVKREKAAKEKEKASLSDSDAKECEKEGLMAATV
jgi:hypothetical protein